MLLNSDPCRRYRCLGLGTWVKSVSLFPWASPRLSLSTAPLLTIASAEQGNNASPAALQEPYCWQYLHSMTYVPVSAVLQSQQLQPNIDSVAWPSGMRSRCRLSSLQEPTSTRPARMAYHPP